MRGLALMTAPAKGRETRTLLRPVATDKRSGFAAKAGGSGLAPPRAVAYHDECSETV